MPKFVQFVLLLFTVNFLHIASATRFLALPFYGPYVRFSHFALLSPEPCVCGMYVYTMVIIVIFLLIHPKKKILRSNGYEYSPSTIKALKRLINYFVSIRIFRKRHAQSEGRAFPTSGPLGSRSAASAFAGIGDRKTLSVHVVQQAPPAMFVTAACRYV